MFKIYKQDLLDAGVDPNAEGVVIYFQLHESRTLVWNNALQAGYDTPPCRGWGGYLYGTDGWPVADPVSGSGYVPGSSGHVHVEAPGGGRDVPTPISMAPPGVISGLKWEDSDGDGVDDVDESGLSGWEIHLCATLEAVDFAVSAHTDAAGGYSFGDLTTETTWVIKEDSQRDVPPETGYEQTYPTVGLVLGQGLGVAVAPPPAGVAPVGWAVELTRSVTTQGDMNFGNESVQGGIPARPPEATRWGRIKSLFAE